MHGAYDEAILLQRRKDINFTQSQNAWTNVLNEILIGLIQINCKSYDDDVGRYVRDLFI